VDDLDAVEPEANELLTKPARFADRHAARPAGALERASARAGPGARSGTSDRRRVGRIRPDALATIFSRTGRASHRYPRAMGGARADLARPIMEQYAARPRRCGSPPGRCRAAQRVSALPGCRATEGADLRGPARQAAGVQPPGCGRRGGPFGGARGRVIRWRTSPTRPSLGQSVHKQAMKAAAKPRRPTFLTFSC